MARHRHRDRRLSVAPGHATARAATPSLQRHQPTPMGLHEATVLPLSRINRRFMLAPFTLMSRVSWSLREAPAVLRRAGTLWMEAKRVVTAKVLSWREGPEPAFFTIEDTRA